MKKDITKTVEWMKKLAEQGDSEVQYHLGEYYYYGEGIEEN